MTRRCLLPLALLVLSPLAAMGAPPAKPDLSGHTFDHWEREIGALEELDRQGPDPDGAVLLIGSSSIRLWETAADDLAPYPVIRRGFGGSRFTDVAHFAERLVLPHKYRAVVVFVANDVTGGAGDLDPAFSGELFGYLADLITLHQPDAQIVCCDVRPAPSRFHLWDRIQGTNAALRAECAKRPGVHYLDTSDAYLTDGGAAAREDVYGPDRLHLNAKGYALWSGQIKAELDRVLEEKPKP